MADDSPDTTEIGRYDWERLVKRAKMHPSTKLVALTIATYSDKSGTRMYPGVAKLAAVTGLTEKTVRAALKTLRDDLRLLERTFDGSKNGRRGLADVYRLRRPHDIERRTHMLDVGESPEAKDCHDGCQHPGTPEVSSPVPAPKEAPPDTEHRNSVPGTPVMSSGTPEVSSTNTGTEFPPSAHDHPRNQPLDQRDDLVSDVTTRGRLVTADDDLDQSDGCATCDRRGQFAVCCPDHSLLMCPGCYRMLHTAAVVGRAS